MLVRPIAVLCVVLAACGRGRSPAADPMQVVGVNPAIGSDGAGRVFLNQDITVYLSHPVDPLSVTPDTVRVVDEEGHPVRGRLRVWTRSVTFEPIPPVTSELDDGTLAPDRSYRLEIPGLPLFDAIRSRSGARLARTLVIPFRTVEARPADFATPLLPPNGPIAPRFALDPDTRTHMAADTGRFELHFNQPVSPQSVSRDAVRLLSMAGDEPVSIPPDAIRILAEQRAPEAHFGSTVEVVFEPSRLDPANVYYLELAGEPAGLRDYLGRPIAERATSLQVWVVPGDRARLVEVGGDSPWRLERDRAAEGIGFLAIDGRLEPACRVEAGSGALGWLRPTESITIRPGETFDAGGGKPTVATDDLHFAGIDIPEGVVVTVRSDTPVRMRSRGPVEILGRLVLDTPLTPVRWSHLDHVSLDSVLHESGCSLIAGGGVRVPGAIEHARPREPGSPLTLVCGGDLEVVPYRMPAEIVVGLEPTRQIAGPLESPVRIECRLTPGVAAPVEAATWTGWLRLPAECTGPLEVELDSPLGAFDVAVQIAPPHPVDPGRPDLELHRVGPLVPISDRPLVDGGAFVRFHVRAPVAPGEPLPSLGAIRVVGQ